MKKKTARILATAVFIALTAGCGRPSSEDTPTPPDTAAFTESETNTEMTTAAAVSEDASAAASEDASVAVSEDTSAAVSENASTEAAEEVIEKRYFPWMTEDVDITEDMDTDVYSYLLDSGSVNTEWGYVIYRYRALDQSYSDNIIIVNGENHIAFYIKSDFEFGDSSGRGPVSVLRIYSSDMLLECNLDAEASSEVKYESGAFYDGTYSNLISNDLFVMYYRDMDDALVKEYFDSIRILDDSEADELIEEYNSYVQE